VITVVILFLILIELIYLDSNYQIFLSVLITFHKSGILSRDQKREEINQNIFFVRIFSPHLFPFYEGR
jgi:hypothetical protein